MTLTEPLGIVGSELEVLASAARTEATLDDLPDLTDHLRALGEHGRAVEIVIRGLLEGTGSDHNEIGLCLMHAGNLFEAAQTFAGNAVGLLQEMHAEPS